MLSRFGDIWIGYKYIYTSDWSGSCSEEGPLLRSALPRPLYVKAYRRSVSRLSPLRNFQRSIFFGAAGSTYPPPCPPHLLFVGRWPLVHHIIIPVRCFSSTTFADARDAHIGGLGARPQKTYLLQSKIHSNN